MQSAALPTAQGAKDGAGDIWQGASGSVKDGAQAASDTAKEGTQAAADTAKQGAVQFTPLLSQDTMLISTVESDRGCNCRRQGGRTGGREGRRECLMSRVSTKKKVRRPR